MAKLSLIGNLTKDIEMKTFQNGVKFYTGDIAENRNKEATFYQITINLNYGDKIAQYLTKGTKIYVRGTLNASAYIAKSGDAKPNISIYVDEIELLGNKSENPIIVEQNNNTVTEPNSDKIPF